MCPLCQSGSGGILHVDRARPYIRCPECCLVYVPAPWHVSPDEARARYDLHKNDPDDAGYRRFLSRLVDPMASRLPLGSKGLDFGSGPGPTLCRLFAEKGFAVENYDPFYAADARLLRAAYDFVACTETVEHFVEPRKDWEQLAGLVLPGGLLGIMTGRVEDGMDFARWHYINDKTHVAFYSRATLEWLARRHGWAADFVAPTVVLMRRLNSGD